MALELVLVLETDPPVTYTCADGTGIEKGQLLRLIDPATVIVTSGSAQTIAGVAAQEKVANDGKTKIAVYEEGRFIARAGGSITVGDSLIN